MNSIRSSVHDLHDDAIDLEDAIKGLVKDFTFCPVNLTYDMSRQIPREVKYSLISITKEGLSNVMRHSNADSVDILLREHPALYQLCIEDNGTPENGIPDIQTGSDSNKAKIFPVVWDCPISVTVQRRWAVRSRLRRRMVFGSL